MDEATRQLWRSAPGGHAASGRGDKLDHARADYAAVVAGAQQSFGDKVLPVYLHEGDDVVGLLTGDDPAHEERGALIEGVIEESEDETLMERYVGEGVDQDLLVQDLERAVARGSFFPVLPVCSTTGVGTRELLDMVVAGFPSPLEHPLPEVFTPRAGRARRSPATPTGRWSPRWSRRPPTGTSAGSAWSASSRGRSVPTRRCTSRATSPRSSGPTPPHEDHDEDERVGALSAPLGKQQRPAALAVAGDLCAIGRLSRAETGDTLGQGHPAGAAPVVDAGAAAPGGDRGAREGRRGQALPGPSAARRRGPDAAVEHNAETHQIVLWCMGEAHADVLLDRLGSRFGATVDQVPLRVPLRGAFAGLAKGHGRHVKQSGGHGQYAVCDIEVEPLPEGSGLEFVDKVVGGAVRQFIPSVEKGVRAQMEKGCPAATRSWTSR